jgi:protein pelota
MKLGEIELQVENLDDLWQLYNIIEAEDSVYAQTYRRIRLKKETLRADKGEKVKLYLGIRVVGVEFHPFSNRLRVKGVIIEGPEDLITLGAHHTINIEVLSQFKIKKDEWPKVQIIRLNDAVSESKAAQVMVIVIDEREATMGLVTNIGIKFIAHLTGDIPGKRFKITYHNQSVQNFFHEINKVVAENINQHDVQAIIIAGPGFTKEHFENYLRQKNPDISIPIMAENASSANKSGIYEVIKRGATSKILGSLRISLESELVEEVLRRLGKNQRDITYGINEIKTAALSNAVENLLITDIFLREQSHEVRKEIDDLIRNVEYNRGKVYVISTLHPAGEQLHALGGVAALLRYPL